MGIIPPRDEDHTVNGCKKQLLGLCLNLGSRGKRKVVRSRGE